MSNDALSEVLLAVRLSGAIFFDVECSAPWVAETPASCEVAGAILPGLDSVIEYHVIASGECFGGIAGEPSVRLQAGDIIVFPQGDAHVLSSAPGMRGHSSLELYRRPTGDQLRFRIKQGGGGDITHVVCGFIGCDARPFNPLISALPRLIHIRGSTNPGSELLQALVKMATAESAGRSRGSECVLSRVSELLFVEVVRRYVDSLPAGSAGWLGGLRDPVVARALGFLHEEPAHEFTIDDLAKQCGSSRSILAERFTHFVGMPPMQYLAQWRIQLACSLLRGGSLTIAQVAEQVGYASEAAFSRAFKRMTQASPGAYRRERLGHGAQAS